MIFHAISFKREDNLSLNINKLEEIINQTINKTQLNFYFLGELIFDDYNMTHENINKNKYSQDSREMKLLKDLASRYGIVLSFGYIEELGDKVYNSQVVINNYGEIIHNHQKSNLTNKEREVFEPGDSPVTSFDLYGTKISLAICYDLFSPLFKENYQKDSKILLHSLTDPQDGRFTLGFSGRITSSFYIAANRYNDEYNGHIGIYSTTGKKIGFSMNKEDIISFDFDQNKQYLKCKFLNYIRIFFHLITHLKKTINYLKWSKKN
jgi:predicted amidohydrolase